MRRSCVVARMISSTREDGKVQRDKPTVICWVVGLSPKGDVAIKSEELEVVRGSGNVFRDVGHEDADAEQFKAILAAEIIKAFERFERLPHTCERSFTISRHARFRFNILAKWFIDGIPAPKKKRG